MDHLVLWGRDGPTDLVGVWLGLTILCCGVLGGEKPFDLVVCGMGIAYLILVGGDRPTDLVGVRWGWD